MGCQRAGSFISLRPQVAITKARHAARPRGDITYLTLQADELGALTSLTVSHDGAGNGPDWYLEWIDVDSARYDVRARATFGAWIEAGPAVTQPVVAR